MSPQLERKAKARKRYAVEVIEGYAEIAREIMLNRGWKVNSCIAATAVTINVLAYFRLAARPCAVMTTLHNQAWEDLAASLGRVPRIEEFDGTAAWAIGLGYPARPEDPPDGASDYSGHLVTLALGDQLLIDASLDQASRPEREMPVAAKVVLAGITPSWLTADPEADEGIIVAQNRERTVTLTYRRRDDAPDWTQSPDWQPYRHGDVELAIIRRLFSMGIRPLDARV